MGEAKNRKNEINNLKRMGSKRDANNKALNTILRCFPDGVVPYCEQEKECKDALAKVLKYDNEKNPTRWLHTKGVAHMYNTIMNIELCGIRFLCTSKEFLELYDLAMVA